MLADRNEVLQPRRQARKVDQPHTTNMRRGLDAKMLASNGRRNGETMKVCSMTDVEIAMKV